MSSVELVPETWDLSGDDAWETLASTGRLRLASDAFRRFRAADGTSHARSIAFLSGLIVIQGIVAVLGLASALGEGALSRLIVDTLQRVAPGPAGKLLTQAVAQAHKAGGSHRYAALIVGLAAVLLSGTMLIGQFERGLNRIYGIERDRPTVSKYGRAFVLAVSAGLMIAAAFVALGIGRSIAGSLGSRTSVRIWDVARWPVGIALATATVALLYRWSPRRRMPAWSWLAFGASVAVGLWTLATVALGVFFAFSSSFGQTYGPLAGIIALALWSFAASTALLYGASVAAQLEAVRAGAPAPREERIRGDAPLSTTAPV
jgi:YihY family inner membrane protein